MEWSIRACFRPGSAWIPFWARSVFQVCSGLPGSRAVDRSFRHGFRWDVLVGFGPGWPSSDQVVPGLACSVRVSSCFVFLLWSWCVRRLVQVQVWLRIYSSDWLAPWLVRVVCVSSCFAVGHGLIRFRGWLRLACSDGSGSLLDAGLRIRCGLILFGEVMVVLVLAGYPSVWSSLPGPCSGAIAPGWNFPGQVCYTIIGMAWSTRNATGLLAFWFVVSLWLLADWQLSNGIVQGSKGMESPI